MEEKTKSLKINTIFYLLYNVLNVLFPFITGIYVTKILLPSGIGQVESAKNFVQYFAILSFLGIPTYGLREISKVKHDQNKLNKLCSELFLINFCSTLFFSIIYFSLIFFVSSYRSNFKLYSIVGFMILLNFFNVSWLYEGLEEFRFISIRNLIFKVLSFLLLIFFVKNEDDVLQYALISVVGASGNYILDILFVPTKFKLTFSDLNLKQHMKSIMFLVVVNLAIEIYSLVDVTMLTYMTDSDTVAFYSYGSKIFKILLQIINTFTIVLVPRIALYYKEEKYDLYNNLLTKTIKIILFLAVPLVVGIFFVSDYLITFIYGSQYIRSAYVLKILSVILLISPISYLLGSRVMLVSNNENKMIIPVLAGAIINVVGNFILIYFFAEYGASIASVLGEIVVAIVYILLSRKYFKLGSLLNEIFKIFFASIAMGITIYFVSYINLNDFFVTFIQIIVGALIYFMLLLLMKEDIIIDFISSLKRRKIYG